MGDINAKQYSDEELKKLRCIQLELLDEVIRICEKFHLEYVAVEGTALGARRHQGYVPWDDDLDIAFMREDYERFLKAAEKELDERYFLQNYHTDPNSIGYFSKLRKNGTCFLQDSDIGIQMNTGIFIDIFPIDRVPDGKIQIKLHRWRVYLLHQCFIAKGTTGTTGENVSLKGKTKKIIRSLLNAAMSFVPKKYLFQKLDRALQKYNWNRTGKIAVMSEYMLKGLTYSYDCLFPVKKQAFEGKEIAVPADMHKYLTLVYGDYMKLPPVSKRRNHRPAKLKFESE